MNDALIEVTVYTIIGDVIEKFVTNISDINIINDFMCNFDEEYGSKFDKEAISNAVKRTAKIANIGMPITPFSSTDYSGYYTLVVNEINFVH